MSYNSKDLQPVIKKSIGVASGKGGVGKTVTAANLSIYYAKKGFHIGLIDLDPLSDLAAILDIYEPEKVVKPETGNSSSSNELKDYSINVLPNIDLIFPAPKISKKHRTPLIDMIYSQFSQELNEKYDILIFDMPAGSDVENNLSYLPFMNTLLLVTNPEPTAHVAAGEYIRCVLDNNSEKVINIWHNRYNWGRGFEFNPRDVAGNYNKNVNKSYELTAEQISKIKDFAFIPDDPALNLLRSKPSVVINIQRSILDVLGFIQDITLSAISTPESISDNMLDLIRFYINRNRYIDNTDTYLDQLGAYLNNLLSDSAWNPTANEKSSIEPFTAHERKMLLSYLQAVKKNRLRQSVVKATDLFEEKLEMFENSERLFFSGGKTGPDKSLNRETGRLLILLNKASESNKALKNYGGLFLFYYSLYKLFQSNTVITLISKLVPQKKDNKGRSVRDRRLQIKYLLDNDSKYQKKFLSLLKLLFPVLSKQLMTITKAFELSHLIYRDKQNNIIKKAYVKLLANFLHDTIYSGLSIVVGYDYRPSSMAFQEGAEKLLNTLSI